MLNETYFRIDLLMMTQVPHKLLMGMLVRQSYNFCLFNLMTILSLKVSVILSVVTPTHVSVMLFCMKYEAVS